MNATPALDAPGKRTGTYAGKYCRSRTLTRLTLLSAALLLGAGCGDPGDNTIPIDPMELPTAKFQVRESIEQLHITHATPGAELQLVDRAGKQVQTGKADALGSLVFRKVAPAGGYVVRTADGREQTRTLTVLSVAGSMQASDFYRRQKLSPGNTYITMRDGTQLSAFITLPGPPEKGPYPTVVNYSGYDPAKPGGKSPELEFLCGSFPSLCDQPADPSAFIASLMGYATVGVNVRGTGCSGGAFDFFDTLQQLDAYDVIEAVAAQPWVLHNKVGTSGLSYPGYSQLFIGAMRPPSLAAITPLSVFGSTFQVLQPGGILNTGFAVAWAQQVLDRASPYAQGWEKGRVEAGDTVCAENQLLHGQKVNIIEQVMQNPYYRADLGDPITPDTFASKVAVPVFMASAWQDEQTGPYFSTLIEKLQQTPRARFMLYNGVHVDGFAPQILVEWKTFLDLYVAKRVPSVDSKLRAIAPTLFKRTFGASLEIPPDRLADQPSHAAALALYEKEPAVRVLFESGAGSGGMSELGSPEAAYDKKFTQWPPQETTAQRWYFGDGGVLQATAPTAMTGAATWQHDPDAGQRGVLATGGDPWALLPKYDYQPLRAGKAVAFVSPVLTEDVLMAGTGSVDLYLQSSATEADLQVTLTEVRGDGNEMYVQSGYLRASQRALSKNATPLWPEHTHLAGDASMLPAGQWTLTRVGIPAFAHAFRKGSRVRIGIDTPGGVRAAWKFKLTSYPGPVSHQVAYSAMYPSSVALPVLTGLRPETKIPACPSLRGQPCRAYVPLVNTPAP